MVTTKKIIRQILPFMKSKGFQQNKKYFYYIKNDLAYSIEFDSPSGLLYCTFSIVPLFIPSEFRYYTYGNRIHSIVNIAPLSKDAQDREYIEWCDCLCDCFEKYIFPMFEKINTASVLCDYVAISNRRDSIFSCCPNMFISRLRVFTYLYNEEYDSALLEISAYSNQIKQCDLLTDCSKQIYRNEIEVVRPLAQARDVSHYLQDTIKKTTRLFVD